MAPERASGLGQGPGGVPETLGFWSEQSREYEDGCVIPREVWGPRSLPHKRQERLPL
jgi:hypothetical protein